MSNVLAMLTAALSVAITPADSGPPIPAPGRLIDVGGWKMHIYCTGTSQARSPTVVLEAGAGDFSVEWSLVQPGVSRFTRVCSYDRSDDGWSDWGPHPRTLHQDVYELHTLLEKAGERGPFVLVGHSYGGWIVRLYASTYREQVAGLVFIEGGLDNPVRQLPNGKLVHSSDLVTGRPIPPVKTSDPLKISDIPPDAYEQMVAATVQMKEHANEPPRDKLPPDAQRMRAWAIAQVKHYGIADNPVEPEELAELAAERVRTPDFYGNLPLVVIERGIVEDMGPDNNAATEDERRRDFAAVAAMSRTGRVIVAAKSGHHVQIEQPDLVISAIHEVAGRSIVPDEHDAEP